ncbi:signal transduction histidine kinase [Kineococcus xinjiangensis]|uniref:histidine kinase n=1 Tax=Kineococcus xinjiangensis TaxID=512762 RepID=A0A2S6IG19_9ACTN|nr:nitrate- and nitrite sensing domain-containing protein [Kineococcus xinjiangensis]PPK93137.1 signal transduction histidine kinase [Kineococcus xinjiangensis]
MLRNLSIRAKLLALLAVPLALLLGTVTALNLQFVEHSTEKRALAQFASGGAAASANYRAFQRERLLSMQYLLDKHPATRLQLITARRDTDATYAAAADKVNSSGIDWSQGTAAPIYRQMVTGTRDSLPKLRQAVDAGVIPPIQVLSSYTAFIQGSIGLITAVANDSDEPHLAAQLRAFATVQSLSDAVSQEQLAGVLLLRGQDPQQATAVRLAAVVQQEMFGKQLPVVLPEDELQELDDALATNAAAQSEVSEARKIFNGTATTGAVDLKAWVKNSDVLVSVYQDFGTQVGEELAESAQEEADATQTQIVLFTGISALVILFALAVAIVFGRSVGRRLARLAAAAIEVRDELPRMVERMQTPGEGPGVEIVPLDDDSKDEVGQLSRVINDLNTTTIRIAGEQAALRASIAEMFVNVARRDQALLARQLAFLDQLERTEENPDTLEDLFTLDHLATRMRRNAESLLVLAGINTGRRLRRPLPLSDVIRTAAGEIEHYDRVDLALQVDPPVVGHLALSLAHMIAELLENATNFSDPSSRVVVSTTETGTGVQVLIVDKGLGMPEEEVTNALQRISGAKASEVVGAQRLGFFVVGRLAGRLEVEVGIAAEEGKGTTVTLDLSPSLFVPGSVSAAPAVTAAPAPAELPAAPAASSVTAPLDAMSDEAVRSVQEITPEPTPQPTRPTASSSLPTRRPLPTRGGGAQAPEAPKAPAAAKAQSLPAVPVMPKVDVPLSVEAGWTPENLPAVKEAPKVMPRRRKAGEAPAPAAASSAAAPAGAAQDILPKRGTGKPRTRRESPVPPRTAAEALWTSRSRAEAAAPQAPAAAPAPVAEAPVAEAPAPVPVSPALPQRRRPEVPAAEAAAPAVEAEAPVAEAAAPVVEAPAPAPAPAAEPARPQRSSVAADALSALAEGATFRPTMGGGSQPLVRRQAGATPAAAKPVAARPAAARQRRAPADVRSMLSGFQAGVSRGRATTEPGDAPTAEGGADERTQD